MHDALFLLLLAAFAAATWAFVALCDRVREGDR
jgi:hypothetical protein